MTATLVLLALVGFVTQSWWLLAVLAPLGWLRWRGHGRLVMLSVALVILLGAAAVLILSPGSGAARFIGWDLGGLVMLVLAVLALSGYETALHRLRDLRPALPEAGPGLVPAEPAGALAPQPSSPKGMPSPAALSDDELDRYARHIVLREIGGPGQQKLRAARVLVVGAGALGSPVLAYLAAAGVGRITVADDDSVSLSNLQRQVLFDGGDLGLPKTRAAARRLAALNPNVQVTPLPRRIGAGDAALVGEHDLVLDGTDSFASRAGLNAACVAAKVPLVAGAIAQWEGQVTVWDPARGAPCMACLFPEAPAPGLAPSCAEAGVVGALPGVIGSLMALEAIKLLTGAGAAARGRLLIFDGLWGETRSIAIARDPACPVCAAKG